MGFRHLLIAKVAIIVAIALVVILEVEVGEKVSVGQDKVEEASETEKIEGEELAEANIEEPSSEEDLLGFQDNEEGLKIVKSEQSRKDEREGFFHGLLELPNFNSDKAKREDAARYIKIVERLQGQVRDRLELLKSKYGQLKDLEDQIDLKLKKIDEEMAFFQTTIQKEKEIQKDRLDNLIDFYVKMEPKKAAPIFEQMDKDLRVALFQKMKKKQVTAILENMAPEKSVEASEYYGRIFSGREYDLTKALNLNNSLKAEFDRKCKTVDAE